MCTPVATSLKAKMALIQNAAIYPLISALSVFVGSFERLSMREKSRPRPTLSISRAPSAGEMLHSRLLTPTRTHTVAKSANPSVSPRRNTT